MKKTISLILALTMLVCGALSLTACDTPTEECTEHTDTDGNKLCDTCGEEMPKDSDPTPDSGKDYTVTVIDHEGNPIRGLNLKLLYEDKATDILTTGADGRATAKIATQREVTVEFIDLKEYGTPNKKNSKFDDLEYELTITLNPLITVKVVDENGSPVAGVSVQICHDSCLLPKDTDENGIMTQSFVPKAKLKVSIASVPDGYSIPEVIYNLAGTDYHAEFEDGSYTITVTIPSAN